MLLGFCGTARRYQAGRWAAVASRGNEPRAAAARHAWPVPLFAQASIVGRRVSCYGAQGAWPNENGGAECEAREEHVGAPLCALASRKPAPTTA